MIELTTSIVAAYVARNALPSSELPAFISAVHFALDKLAEPELPVEQLPPPEPAVRVSDSIGPDFIICLDDGLTFKSLKRHIATLGMTPDQYRAKWGLPSDYPMVCPNYSAIRSGLAKGIGLGRRPALAQAA